MNWISHILNFFPKPNLCCCSMHGVRFLEGISSKPTKLFKTSSCHIWPEPHMCKWVSNCTAIEKLLYSPTNTKPWLSRHAVSLVQTFSRISTSNQVPINFRWTWLANKLDTVSLRQCTVFLQAGLPCQQITIHSGQIWYHTPPPTISNTRITCHLTQNQWTSAAGVNQTECTHGSLPTTWLDSRSELTLILDKPVTRWPTCLAITYKDYITDWYTNKHQLVPQMHGLPCTFRRHKCGC